MALTPTLHVLSPISARHDLVGIATTVPNTIVPFPRIVPVPFRTLLPRHGNAEQCNSLSNENNCRLRYNSPTNLINNLQNNVILATEPREWNTKPEEISTYHTELQQVIASRITPEVPKKKFSTKSTKRVLSEEGCKFIIHGKQLFSCPVCSQTFSLFSEVQKHVQVHPLKIKKFQCDVCKKTYESNSVLTRHKRSHTEDRPFPCEICDKTFKTKNQVDQHQKIHTGEKQHFCDQCVYATRSKCELVYHKNSLHEKLLDFVCKLCGKNCSSPYHLKLHQKIHGERKFKCKHCEKAYFNNGDLKFHEESHNPNRIKLQCEICGKKYTHNTGLTKHKQSAHLGVKKKSYHCEFCETVVTSLSSLRIHRRRHTGDKPFSCDVCEKAFNSKNYLIAHKRIHTGEKPFTCHLCNKSFNQQGTLMIHKRSHTGDKPYECDKCCKAFVTKTVLKAHMKSHA